MAVQACLATFAPLQAGTDDRTLRLFNTHTGEHAVVTFKRNGQYLPEGLRQANIVLRDWRRNEPTTMDPKLLDLVWEVYQESGSNTEIHIVSGYRAPATNAMLAAQSSLVAENSQHMAGKAMDFYLPDVPLARLRSLGLQLQIGGVGYYPTSGSPFIHLDTGSVRHWPRMTRTQLAAVFPEGRSLHVPTDGNPLPGYQQALAEYRAQGYVTPQSREAATFLASLYGSSNSRAPAPTIFQTAPTVQIAAAQPAPQIVSPVPRGAPRIEPAAPAAVMVAAATPMMSPVPRAAPADGRIVPIPAYDYAAIQIAAAAPVDLSPPMAIVAAANAPPGEALAIPAMAFAAEFAGSYPDPFRALSADIGRAEPLTPPAPMQMASVQPASAHPGVAQPGGDAIGTVVAMATPAPLQPMAAPTPPAAPRLAVASLVPSFNSAADTRPPAVFSETLPSAAVSAGYQEDLAIWTAKTSTRQGEMAALSAPPVEPTSLMDAPEQVYAVGFATLANGDLRTDRFTGSAVSTVSTAFVLVPNRIQLASR